MIDKKKKVVFYELEHNYANLKIRLRYDRIKQKDFFCFCIKSYIENEPSMLKLIEKFKEENNVMGTSRRKRAAKDHALSKALLKELGITEEDKEEIFDLIESQLDIE